MASRLDIPAEIRPFVTQTEEAANAYLQGLGFIVNDTARDSNFPNQHIFSYLVEDLLQSAISVPMLAAEGMWSVARRELRFLLEASIKQAVIQCESYDTSIKDKLEQFDQLLASTSISIKNNLRLGLLDETTRRQFLDEVGRLYGEASNYVHLTPTQVQKRMEAVQDGHSVGFESKEEAKAAADLCTRTFAASLVLLLHSVPEYVAGDLLVESDGASADWFFVQSRFIAFIDSHFDYKHERQLILEEVRRKRHALIRF